MGRMAERKGREPVGEMRAHAYTHTRLTSWMLLPHRLRGLWVPEHGSASKGRRMLCERKLVSEGMEVHTIWRHGQETQRVKSPEVLLWAGSGPI